MPLGGPALLCQHHALADQHLRAQLKPLMGHWYFRTHFNVLQAKDK
jgi:hypothetical protein